MKLTKKISVTINKRLSRISTSLVLGLSSCLSYAATDNGDIMRQIVSGSLGKTLGKEGLIWGFLTAVSFGVGTFYAAIKSDPKAFIPAFIVMAVISTITGAVLTF